MYLDAPSALERAFVTRLGSPNYVAPEIVSRRRGYDVKVDVWSLGVILYIMLCGYFPFYAETEKELYRQIRRGAFEMPAEEWANISDGATNVVRAMLVVDPKERATAHEVLQLSWLREDTGTSNDIELVVDDEDNDDGGDVAGEEKDNEDGDDHKGDKEEEEEA